MTRENIHLNFIEVGRGHGVPIILLHGLGFSKDRWKIVISELEKRTERTIFAVDFRNHGDSDGSSKFSTDILAEDIAYFIECTVDIPSAVIIGHNIGGIVAMKLAMTRPELVESIVIEDTSPKKLDIDACTMYAVLINAQIEVLSKMKETASSEDLQATLREAVIRTVPKIPDADREALDKLVFPLRKTSTQTNILKLDSEPILEALFDVEAFSLPLNESSDIPALFIYGGKSPYKVGKTTEVIKHYFPNSTLVCIKEAGHELSISHTSEFIENLASFLKKK